MSLLKAQILNLKARLADSKKRLKETEVKAEAHQVAVQQKMDPYTDFPDLDLEAVLVSVQELISLQKQYHELAKDIREMEDDLG